MALRLAMRMPNGLNIEDLMSVGTLGLLDALGKFDPTRNIKFRTYAEFRIRGAMLDEIRAMDWVPRSIRKQIGQIQHATNEYTRRKWPSSYRGGTGLEYLKWRPKKIDKVLLQAKGTVLLSLEDIRAQDDEPQSVLNGLVDRDQPTPFGIIVVGGTGAKILADSLDRLPERQRLVLNLYHFQELTMKENWCRSECHRVSNLSASCPGQ